MPFGSSSRAISPNQPYVLAPHKYYKLLTSTHSPKPSMPHSSRQSSAISEASFQPTHSPATPSSYNAQTTSDSCSPPRSAPTVGFQILPSQLPRKCIFRLSVSSSANELRSGERRGPHIGILAEIASCQLEYTYLAKETGKKRYFDLVRIPCQCLHQM